MAKFNSRMEEKFRDDENKISECAMYLSTLLSEEDSEKLKKDWNNEGGYEVIPFWRYVFDNVDVAYKHR